MRHWTGLLCLATCALAQQPDFRAGTRLVQVDVVVRDSHGPVTGLTKDDFQLFDKGQPQKISVFAVTSGRNSAQPAPAPLPPDAVSNSADRTSGEASAATVVLLDFLNSKIQDQSFARGQVAKFIHSLADADRMALLAQRKNLVVLQDFTRGRNRDQLFHAVEHLPFEVDEDQLPRERTGAEFLYWRQTRIDTTRQSLEAIVRHLSALPGRKNLVWISGDFFYDPIHRDLVWPGLLPMLKEANIALYMVGERGLMAPPANADRAVNRRQPINPRVSAPNDFAINADLRHVAESTGGLGFFDTNDLQGSLQSAIDDTLVTYTLGFYPSDTALDGTVHALKVKLARKGLEVRNRDSYYASAADSGPIQRKTEQQTETALEDLMGDPLDATAIGLTAVPQPSGVNVAVNLRDLNFTSEEGRWRGSFDVAFERTGMPMKFRTIALDFSEDEFRAESSKPYAVSIPVPAGAAGHLRIAVRDRANGNAGSLLMPLK